MSLRALRARRRDEGGAAAIETALCLCFLVLPLTFATISYGYMLSFRQSLSQAAAEGARAAAVAPDPTSAAGKTVAEGAAKTAINNAMTGLADGLTCKDAGPLTCKFIWSTTGCGTAATGGTLQCLTVKVNYKYKDNPLLPTLPGFGFTLPSDLGYDATAQVG